MSRRGRGSVAALLVLLLLAVVPASAPAQSARAKADRALRALVTQAQRLPAAATTKARRASLVRSARRARTLARRSPCRAVAELERFRRTLRPVKPKRGRTGLRLAGLAPASVQATRALLGDRRTRSCGGGVTPSTRIAPAAQVTTLTPEKLVVRVELPELRMAPRAEGGRTWTELRLPDTDSPQRAGTPGIPVVSKPFIVPPGAQVRVSTAKAQTVVIDGVDVLPAQPPPLDQLRPAPNFRKAPFSDRKFVFDPAAYRRAATGRAPLAGADVVGRLRDVTIGSLDVPAARYDARRRRLEVVKAVEVTVDLPGAGALPEELGSPWELSQRRIVAGLLNAGAFGPFVERPPILEPCGEELLVITNPSTAAAAELYRAGRTAAGYLTRVVHTGGGAGEAGTTAAEIRSFIRGRLTNGRCIKPSFVTIMGDDDLVPTHQVAVPGYGNIASDNPYAQRDDTDLLPDIAVGRIIGDDDAALQTVVTKIRTYQETPPTDATWERNALIAAQFQDDDGDGQEDRTFIQFAERVRSGMVARGLGVTRVYGREPHPATKPAKFNDGTDLPAALKPPFAWDGDGADVTAAWNAGRFVVLHRDHGWSDGWGTPGFTTTDAEALTNGARLPVVFSINCSSGAYDYDETSFATQALGNPNGGAVGVFGDTRDSPSWHNTQIALGFADATMPYVLPGEGPATAQRMGEALMHGKTRLAGLASPATDNNTRAELALWHFFGDPTMQLWGGRPRLLFDPSRIRLVFERRKPPFPDPGPWEVRVVGLPEELAGQTLSVLQRGQVVGKGNVVDGAATLVGLLGDGSVKPGELQVAFEGDGYAPVRMAAPDDGSGQPQPVPAPTLTQSCPQGGTVGEPVKVTGSLAGAAPGSAVKVTFTAPGQGGRTVVRDVTTDASGAWAAEVTPESGEAGMWGVRSEAAGAEARTCQVPVSRKATQLSMTCPSSTKVGNGFTVTGTLAGAPAGAVVQVTFRDPLGAEETVDAVVGRTGAWSAQTPFPSRAQSGSWQVRARYAGTQDLGPSEADCQVPIS